MRGAEWDVRATGDAGCKDGDGWEAVNGEGGV